MKDELIKHAKELMLSDGDANLTPEDVSLFCASCAKKMKAKKMKTVKASVIKKALARSEEKKAKNLNSTEFNTKEEMNQYLKDHPGADRSNHSVKKEDKKGPGVMKPSLDKVTNILEDSGIEHDLGQEGNDEVINVFSKKDKDKVLELAKKHNFKVKSGPMSSLIITASESKKAVSDRQKEYQEFFKKTLEKYDVASPSEMDDETKKKFFEEIDSGWKSEDESKSASVEINNQILASNLLKVAKELLVD